MRRTTATRSGVLGTKRMMSLLAFLMFTPGSMTRSSLPSGPNSCLLPSGNHRNVRSNMPSEVRCCLSYP